MGYIVSGFGPGDDIVPWIFDRFHLINASMSQLSRGTDVEQYCISYVFDTVPYVKLAFPEAELYGSITQSGVRKDPGRSTKSGYK